ncbi:MAG: nickel-dependent lactate racemase [Defluviitaleaceae bacterium]|nr:nickel-dependent lactate racemase [Defluviitaleaceae bacterium]
MSTINLRYGEKQITLDTSGAKSIETLAGVQKPAIVDLPLAFRQAVEDKCISTAPLKSLLSSDDQVTIIISDITRFWMRQNQICPLLVDYLCDDIGVPHENVTILVALGTHRFQTESEMKTLVTNGVFQKIKVVNHDCHADDLVCLGTTSRGNDIFVNPLVTGGRKVIAISGTSHHLMSGFSGGRKSILPGICGFETIRRNHVASLDPHLPKSNPLIGMGNLKRNPVHEDMDEAAALVNPLFGINIAINGEGQISRLMAGDFKATWEESCRECQESMGLKIAEKADMVVVSCGGFPKDMNLYQGCKALINASRAVKDGGEIVFLAECKEGGGTAAFFDWIKPLREGRLDASLREAFTIDGYIFYAFCEAMEKRNVYMLTEIPEENLEGMPIRVYHDVDTLLRDVNFAGKSVYVIPYGGNTVPF